MGAFDLCHDETCLLDHEKLVDALIYADTALLLALDRRSGIATSTDGDHWDVTAPALWHADVHQAAGMVAVQLGIPVVDALVRLRAHAYQAGLRLPDVSRKVVERHLRFSDDTASSASHKDREEPS